MSDTNNEAACSEKSCEGCHSSGNCSTQDSKNMTAELNSYSSIKHVIGVASGKGGVGKSFVTGTLASSLRKKGYTVGILDADITGPSIPKMFGIKGPAVGNEMGVVPIESRNGIKIMSINLLMEDEEAPVIWRGPIIAGTVKQFWTEVAWGDLDYLLVDLPPGTGDVPLTVFQSIPLDCLVVVTSPQDLVGLIVKKCLNMAQMMNIPVLGLVENYSYLSCPDCGKKIPVFGISKVDETASGLGLPVLGKIPMNPDFAQKIDAGDASSISLEELSGAVEKIESLDKGDRS